MGIIVIGEKLYIADSEIETVLISNNNIIAGGKNGAIYVWGGKNDKHSRLYSKVLECTQTTNF